MKMKNSIFYSCTKWFFGLLLIASGVGKLLDNRGFAEVILTYQFGIPIELALGLGLGLSLIEFATGIWLLWEFRQPRNAIVLIFLHSGYVVLAVISNLRGLNLKNCGCFGVFWGRPMTWYTVVEDLVLLALSVAFYYSVKVRQRKYG